MSTEEKSLGTSQSKSEKDSNSQSKTVSDDS